MKSVAVFFGGQSVEHDISVITGVMTVNSIDDGKFEAIPVYIHNDGTWYTGKSLLDLDGYKKLNLKKLTKVALVGGSNILYALKGNKIKAITPIAVAINCLHGERGEDGSIAGITRLCKIPLASPDILASAVSMDKRFTKIALKGIGVKTLPSVMIKDSNDTDKVIEKLNFPVIIKPTKLGSSIGISLASDQNQLSSAIDYALRFGESAIVEPCLTDFIEINCAAYREVSGMIKVSECERPIGRTKILSFTDKYEDGKRVFPADIDKKLADKIKKITQKVYNEFDFSGVIRIDYFISGGEIYLNEINTLPGFTTISMYPKLITQQNITYKELITKLIKNAKEL